MLLKKGSKGNEVKALQRALHLYGFLAAGKDDGIFWNLTENAVKEFQKSRGLTADGVVGDKTWAALFKSGDDDIGIIKGYINTHITPSKGRPIKFIAVHYTAGSSSRKGAALNVKNVFQNSKRKASADFVVDDDTIVQTNPDLRNYYCWAVGDAKNKWTGGARLYGVATNRNTISIEICSTLRQGTSDQMPNHEGWSLSEAAVGKARRLVRHLMQQYGIPKERVVRHYDISGKLCPGVPGWNDGPLYDVKGKQTGIKNNSRKWESFILSL